MQTYTHGAIGLFLGTLLSRNPLVQAACAMGAMAPDGFTALKWVWDWIGDKPPLEKQGRLLQFGKHVAHNALLWLALLYVSFVIVDPPPSTLLYVFALGGLSHLVVDLFTHGDPQFQADDCYYFWPAQYRPWNIGRWDYRITTGSLWPLKTFELVTLGFTLWFVVIYQFFALILPHLRFS
ncbi:metal-dependent hydrolase [Candidatus Parcubacteria bacterium]|nr:metal-dependent hydrolase [Candidatus Parcubacteria bacterium]